MSAGKKEGKAAPTLLVLLLIPLLTIGCISGGGSGKVEYNEKGIIILFLEADNKDLSSGQDFNVRAQVQNLGESEATDINLNFFKYGNVQTLEQSWEKELNTLSKPDPAAGLPGETGEKTWRLSAPMVTGRNERVTQELGLVVSYTYSTTALLEIPLLPEESYLQYKQQKNLPVKKTDASVAPIKLEFEAADTVLSDDETFTVTLNLDNIGGGYVTYTDDLDEGKEKVNGIDLIEITFGSSVEPVNSDSDADLDDCDFAMDEEDNSKIYITDQKLWSTGKTKLTCEFMIKNPAQESYPNFKATATYTYNQEQTTQVSITGKRVYVEVSSVSFSCCGEPTCASCREGKDGVFYVREGMEDQVTSTIVGTANSKVRAICAEGTFTEEVEAAGSTRYTLPFKPASGSPTPFCPADTRIYPIIEMTAYEADDAGNIDQAQPRATVRKSSGLGFYIDGEAPIIEFPGDEYEKGHFRLSHSSMSADIAGYSTSITITDAGVGLKDVELISEAPSGYFSEVLYDGSNSEIEYKISADIPQNKGSDPYPIKITAKDYFDQETVKYLDIIIDNTIYPALSFSTLIPERGDPIKFEAWAKTVDNIYVREKDLKISISDAEDPEGSASLGSLYLLDSDTGEVIGNALSPLSGAPNEYAVTTGSNPKAGEKNSVHLKFVPAGTSGTSADCYTIGVTVSDASGNHAEEEICIGKAATGDVCSIDKDCLSSMCFTWEEGTEGRCVGDSNCAWGNELFGIGDTTCKDGEYILSCARKATPPLEGAKTEWSESWCAFSCDKATDKCDSETISVTAESNAGIYKFEDAIGADLPEGAQPDYKVSIAGGNAMIDGESKKRLSVIVNAKDTDNNYYEYDLEGYGAYLILKDMKKVELKYDDRYQSDVKRSATGAVSVKIEPLGDAADALYIHGKHGASKHHITTSVDIDITNSKYEGSWQNIGINHSLRMTLTPGKAYRLTLGGAGINRDCGECPEGVEFYRACGDCADAEKDTTTYIAQVMFGADTGSSATICNLEGKGQEMLIYARPGYSDLVAYLYAPTPNNNYGSVTIEVEELDTYSDADLVNQARGSVYVDALQYNSELRALHIHPDDYGMTLHLATPPDTINSYNYQVSLIRDFKYFDSINAEYLDAGPSSANAEIGLYTSEWRKTLPSSAPSQIESDLWAYIESTDGHSSNNLGCVLLNLEEY